MARFLFLSWNGAGNQPPAVGMAQALKKRGHAPELRLSSIPPQILQRLKIGICDEGLPALLVVPLELAEVLHDHPEPDATASQLPGRGFEFFHMLQHREFFEQQQYRMLVVRLPCRPHSLLRRRWINA